MIPPAKVRSNCSHSARLVVSSILKPLNNNMEPAKVQTAAAIKRRVRLGTAGFKRDKFLTSNIFSGSSDRMTGNKSH